jgi:hypothetical protein
MGEEDVAAISAWLVSETRIALVIMATAAGRYAVT